MLWCDAARCVSLRCVSRCVCHVALVCRRCAWRCFMCMCRLLLLHVAGLLGVFDIAVSFCGLICGCDVRYCIVLRCVTVLGVVYGDCELLVCVLLCDSMRAIMAPFDGDVLHLRL